MVAARAFCGRPRGAPNILLIMTDDQGLRRFRGTFGRCRPDAPLWIVSPRQGLAFTRNSIPLRCARPCVRR